METPADPNQAAPPPANEPTGPKNDVFYKYWDRFLRVKEQAKTKPKTRGPNVQLADARLRSGSVRQILANARRESTKPVVEPEEASTARRGISLEKDIEGRPGHPAVRSNTAGDVSHQNSKTSYDEAAATCRAKVEAIQRECRRLNQKYYDRMFDLPAPDTLGSLAATEQPYSARPLVGVGSVKRVEDIYEDPEFFVDGATANDIRQGSNGDCWFLAAISALTSKPELIERICVARDEQVGVYGFVFFRDGEWISEVVDDRLCLRPSDDSKNFNTEFMVITNGERNPMREPLVNMPHGVTDLPQEFREKLRKGSNALFFASCRESNETWVPLLEKAYAKAHGDYQALEGGYAGEGVEDLTGGIATYIASEDVLDKDTLWSELLQVNDKFLFGCGSRRGRDYDPADDEGFVRGHAYTVLAAKEIDKPENVVKEEERLAKKAGRPYPEKKRTEKVRMLKVQNPWGRQEWNGSWSDGSKEWTPEVMKELDHTFGDDGIFWISYTDFLKYYPEIDRVRLIGSEWTVTQQWTTVKVPYNADYLDTYFSLEVTEQGPVVLVLSQPDERYFRGLQGRYTYDLHFRLYKDGEETYLLRSMESAGSARGCSAELELEPGKYTILVKITASRDAKAKTAEEIIKMFRESRREKLFAIGKSLDAVQSKGHLREMEEEDAKAEKAESKADDKQEKIDERNYNRKDRMRERARRRRREAEEKRKKEAKIKELKEKNKAEKAAKKKAAEEAAAKSKVAEKKVEQADDKTSTENASTKESAESVQEMTPESTPEPSQDDKASEAVVEKVAESKDEEGKTGESTAPDSTTVKDGVGEKGDEPVDVTVELKDEVSQGEPKEKEVADEKVEETAEEKSEEKPVEKDENDVKSDEDEEEEDVEVSDCSDVGDDDFEWDDAVDGSGDESTDDDESEDEDDMFKDDPWSARCVIGLRVCSIDKGVVVSVQTGDSGHDEVEDHE